MALSGTPVENRLSELWSIMSFLNPGLLSTAARFRERFAAPIERDRNRETQQLLRRVIAPFVLRRTKAQVLHELPARTEIVLAQEQLQTERERAVADRSREIALKREQERGEVETSKAESETAVLLMTAKAEASATTTRAEAQRIRLTAESEGARAMIDAENSRTAELMHLQLEQHRLDRLPEIIAQMMKPAEKIDSIRIHQVTGFGGSSNGGAGGGGTGGDAAQRAPVTQVMDSILGMALQLPAMKSIGDSIGVDLSAAVAGPKGGGPAPGTPDSASDRSRPKG